MIDFGLPLAGIGLLLCLLDWRKGVLLTVAVGFLADPIRKLVPGQPVALTVGVALFALASLVGALAVRGPRPALQLARQYRGATLPLQFFIGWVVFCAVLTVINHGSLMLAGIGALAYLAPLPGLLLGYYFASSTRNRHHLPALYIALSIVMSGGIFLQLGGFDWLVLQGIGVEMYISHLGWSYGGFFRTSEVAAWHTAAASCLTVVLVLAFPRSVPRWLAVPIVVFLVIAGLMTGRRKMIAQVLLFGALFGLLLGYYRGTARRLVIVGLAVVVIGGLVSTELIERSQVAVEGPKFERYLERGRSVFGDAPDRLQQLGLGSVVWAIRRHGWMPSGAGVSSQGAQHFGGGSDLVGGAGEGGLGKIVVELGVPGLLIGLWLIVALGRIVSTTIASLTRLEQPQATLACGLAAFLGAQIPTFVAAAQIYGDPFVLITLGSVLGFLLASPASALQPAGAAYAATQDAHRLARAASDRSSETPS